MPISATVVSAVSQPVSTLSAAAMPSGSPSTSATTMPATASWMVGGSACLMRVATVSLRSGQL